MEIHKDLLRMIILCSICFVKNKIVGLLIKEELWMLMIVKKVVTVTVGNDPDYHQNPLINDDCVHYGPEDVKRKLNYVFKFVHVQKLYDL